MSIFDCLPALPRCCYCINLKIGVILMVILSIILSGALMAWIINEVDYNDQNGLAQDTFFDKNDTNFLYALAAGTVIFIIFTFIFIFGIISDKEVIAILYLFATALALLFFTVVFILILLATVVNAGDARPYSTLRIPIFCVGFVWLVYLMIMVRSYKEEMLVLP
ncbi:uncharacterized protein LOC126966886 [Leptidea sinapis]|uniref:uncharacterized protein LOC126966886 n=1 Tax=Leptidea sinapis TaxID=189913 RepID=UPI002135B4E4|nr:uncharacterized protein LOC126966886 [Leptidea sinapis]